MRSSRKHPPEPDPVWLALRRAAHLVDLRRFDTAIDLLRGLPTDGEYGPDVLAALAQAFRGRGDYDDALRAVGAAIAARPDSAWFFEVRARILLLADRFEEAAVAAAESIRLDPVDPFPHEALAQSYFALGKIPDAQREIDLALELDPSNAAAVGVAANLAWSRGDRQRARELWSARIARNPDGATPLLRLAAAMHADGELEAARQLRRRAAARDPSGDAARLVAHDMADAAGQKLLEAVGGIESYGDLVTYEKQLFAGDRPALAGWVWRCRAKADVAHRGVATCRDDVLATVDEVLAAPPSDSGGLDVADAVSSTAVSEALRDYLVACEVGGAWVATHEWGQRRLMAADLWQHETGPGRKAALSRAIDAVTEAIDAWADQVYEFDAARAHQVLAKLLMSRREWGDNASALTHMQAVVTHRRRKFNRAAITNDLTYMSRLALNDTQRLLIERSERAIAFAREALAMDEISEQPKILLQAYRVLGTALETRHSCTWDIAAFDEAVSCWREVARLAAAHADETNGSLAACQLAELRASSLDGRRSENIEAAIAALHQAQLAIDPDVYPELRDYATRELGTLYRLRLVGDRAENCRTALAMALSAYESRRRDVGAEVPSYEVDFARALRDCADGNRADDLEQALTIFTREESRDTHKRDDALLAIRYDIVRTRRFLAEVLDSPAELDGAIELGRSGRTRDALESCPRGWARLTVETGIALASRPHGNVGTDRREAIEYFEAALALFRREQEPWRWDQIVEAKAAVEGGKIPAAATFGMQS